MRFCVLILCRLAKGQRVHVHLLESLVKGLGLKKKKGGRGRHVLGSTLKINQIKLTQRRSNILYTYDSHINYYFFAGQNKMGVLTVHIRVNISIEA